MGIFKMRFTLKIKISDTSEKIMLRSLGNFLIGLGRNMQKDQVKEPDKGDLYDDAGYRIGKWEMTIN